MADDSGETLTLEELAAESFRPAEMRELVVLGFIRLERRSRKPIAMVRVEVFLENGSHTVTEFPAGQGIIFRAHES